VLDSSRQIVDEMERGDVTLALPRHDRAPARLVRPRAERRIVHPDDRLHVVGGIQRLLQRTRRHASERLALRRHIAVILDIGMRIGVGRLPLRLIGLECAFGPDERRLWGQRDEFGRRRPPIVEHTLRVFRVADQRA
jgi:hypothetical protein